MILTIILFAPQLLAVGFNLIVTLLEYTIAILYAIPLILIYVILFIVWLMTAALDYFLEWIYDTVAIWDTNRGKTNNVPDIGGGIKQQMNDIAKQFGQSPVSLPRVKVPQQSYAQQVVQIMAGFGVPEPVAYAILFIFIVAVFVLGLKFYLRG